jgi:hypothetical protein
VRRLASRGSTQPAARHLIIRYGVCLIRKLPAINALLSTACVVDGHHQLGLKKALDWTPPPPHWCLCCPNSIRFCYQRARQGDCWSRFYCGKQGRLAPEQINQNQTRPKPSQNRRDPPVDLPHPDSTCSPKLFYSGLPRGQVGDTYEYNTRLAFGARTRTRPKPKPKPPPWRTSRIVAPASGCCFVAVRALT